MLLYLVSIVVEEEELSNVDLSLDRAIKEKNKKNPYTDVLPQNSFSLKSRNSRKPRSTWRQELDRLKKREKEGGR